MSHCDNKDVEIPFCWKCHKHIRVINENQPPSTTPKRGSYRRNASKQCTVLTHIIYTASNSQNMTNWKDQTRWIQIYKLYERTKTDKNCYIQSLWC